MLSRDENELLTKTGPGTPMGEYIRRFWVPVLLSEDLPEADGAPQRLRILSEDLVAYRATDGTVGVMQNACPHRGASMFFGRNEENGLRCVYHGWKFDVAGACVDMPNEPAESNFKHKIRATAYPTQEKGGLVWAYMGPAAGADRPRLPDFDWLRYPDSHTHVMKHIHEANFLQVIEGEIDSSHVAFLHSRLDEKVTSKTATDWYLRYRSNDTAPRFYTTDTAYGVLIGARRAAEEDSYYWRVTQWLSPFYSRIPRNPGAPLNMRAWVPIDDGSCWSIQISTRIDRPNTPEERERFKRSFDELVPGAFRMTANKDNDYLIDRDQQRTETYCGIPSYPIRIGRAQDGAMTESMGAVVDRTKEHLGTSDSAIIAVRRWMLRAVQRFQQGEAPYGPTHPEVYGVRSGSAVLPEGQSFDEGEGAEVEKFVLRK